MWGMQVSADKHTACGGLRILLQLRQFIRSGEYIQDVHVPRKEGGVTAYGQHDAAAVPSKGTPSNLSIHSHLPCTRQQSCCGTGMPAISSSALNTASFCCCCCCSGSKCCIALEDRVCMPPDCDSSIPRAPNRLAAVATDAAGGGCCTLRPAALLSLLPAAAAAVCVSSIQTFPLLLPMPGPPPKPGGKCLTAAAADGGAPAPAAAAAAAVVTTAAGLKVFRESSDSLRPMGAAAAAAPSCCCCCCCCHGSRCQGVCCCCCCSASTACSTAARCCGWAMGSRTTPVCSHFLPVRQQQEHQDQECQGGQQSVSQLSVTPRVLMQSRQCENK